MVAAEKYRFDFDDDFTVEDRNAVFEYADVGFPRYFCHLPHCSVVEWQEYEVRRRRDN